jgi:hypothetical protein
MKLCAYASFSYQILICATTAIACSSSNGANFGNGGNAGTNGPDPTAGGSAGMAQAGTGGGGHAAGGASGGSSAGGGDAAGNSSVAGSSNTAGGSSGGSANAGGTDGTGGACGTRVTDIELQPGPNSTPSEWCFDPCDPSWITITDPNGKPVPFNMPANCGGLSGYFLSEAEAYPFDGTSDGQCLPPGRYSAKICTRKGTAVAFEDPAPPGNHPQDIPVQPRYPCTATGDPVCKLVTFEYPADGQVIDTLDEPPTE